MNYLEHITGIINKRIARCLPDNRQMLGIAHLAKRSRETGPEEVWPAVYQGHGESIYAGAEDTYTATVYHRALGVTVAKAATGGYGRKAADDIARHRMTMVVFANRDAIGKSPDELAMHVLQLLPATLASAELPKIVKYVAITATDIILSEEQVFGEEYRNVQYFIKPEHLLMKINYTIEGVLKPNCLNTCT